MILKACKTERMIDGAFLKWSVRSSFGDILFGGKVRSRMIKKHGQDDRESQAETGLYITNDPAGSYEDAATVA